MIGGQPVVEPRRGLMKFAAIAGGGMPAIFADVLGQVRLGAFPRPRSAPETAMPSGPEPSVEGDPPV